MSELECGCIVEGGGDLYPAAIRRCFLHDAAPDLLAALEALYELHLFDGHDVDIGEPVPDEAMCRWCSVARRAIAKAKGENQ